MRVRSLPLLSGLMIRRCRELWCRLLSWLDPALLWHRLAATAPIRPLAWESPYAMGAALEKTLKKKYRSNSLLGSEETNLTSIHEDAGSIPRLAQWVKDPSGITVNCGSDLALLRLWCRPPASILIGSLA